MKKLFFLGLFSLIAVEYINAECIACTPATSQRRGPYLAKKRELGAQCAATYPKEKTICESQAMVHGCIPVYEGECINNCLQCSCGWDCSL